MRHILLAGLAAILAHASAAAQEVTLRAVSSFAEGTEFSKNFERFIEKVNSDGKGLLKINYIGGPRAVPPFEVGNAVRSRVVDIGSRARCQSRFGSNAATRGVVMEPMV